VKRNNNGVFGIEELRAAVNLFNNCNETFNQQFTADELIKLYQAYVKSGWDFLPDDWHETQVMQALQGIVPRWEENARGRLAPKFEIAIKEENQ
jgi:hypothetical protein